MEQRISDEELMGVEDSLLLQYFSPKVLGFFRRAGHDFESMTTIINYLLHKKGVTFEADENTCEYYSVTSGINIMMPYVYWTELEFIESNIGVIEKISSQGCGAEVVVTVGLRVIDPYEEVRE